MTSNTNTPRDALVAAVEAAVARMRAAGGGREAFSWTQEAQEAHAAVRAARAALNQGLEGTVQDDV